MGITISDAIFFIVSLFDAYIIYLVMNCFYDERVTSKKIEVLSYLGYFALIVFVYWFIDVPLSFLLVNLTSFMLISYNYKGSLKKRIASSLLIYCILFCVEILTLIIFAGMTHFAIFQENGNLPNLAAISVKVFSFIIALIMKNFKNAKNGVEVSISNWICILVMPLGSLFIMLFIVSLQDIKSEYMIMIVATLLLINFIAFYLFDAISKSAVEKLKNAIISEKYLSYKEQLTLVEKSFASLRSFNMILIIT